MPHVMTSYLSWQSRQYQSTTDWNIDWLSVLIGAVAGIVAILILIRLWPELAGIFGLIASRLRNSLPWKQIDVQGQYLAELADYSSTYHLGGNDVGLEEIFVSPRFFVPLTEFDDLRTDVIETGYLHYFFPELAAGTGVAPPPTVGLSQLLYRGKRIGLSGPPGSGKSTVLAYLAYLSATVEQGSRYGILADFLPAFIHAGDLELIGDSNTDGGSATEFDPLEPLIQVLQGRSSNLHLADLRSLLKQGVVTGQLLLLLDGSDELPASARGFVFTWLAQFLAAYPDIRIIMTVPERGFGPLFTEHFSIAGLYPWRVGQVHSLAKKWAEIRGENLQLYADSFRQLIQYPLQTYLGLQAFQNGDPFHEDIAKIRSVDLLEANLVSLLPGGNGSDAPPWLAPATRDLWQELAYILLIKTRVTMAAGEVVSLAETVLKSYDVLPEPVSVDQLLETVSHCSVFVSRKAGEIAFLSPVWRDYLAAGFLAQAGFEEEILRHVNDPAWQSVLRFYSGRMGAAVLAPKLLEHNNRLVNERLFQLAFLLQEAPDDGAWRREVLINLGKILVDDHNPLILRQRAALSLACTGEDGVIVLLRQLLRKHAAGMRQMALAGIARLAPETGLDLMVRMTEDSDPNVRRTAVHAIAWANGPSLERRLLGILTAEDEVLSRAAAEALALSGTVGAKEILREALADSSLLVRQSAVQGLALVDEEWVIELLEKAVRTDEQWSVQNTAKQAIRSMGTSKDGSFWRDLQPGDQAWLIEWALSRGQTVPVGPAALPVLQEALKSEDAGSRAKAAMTLGQLAARQAQPLLLEALDDTEAEVSDASFVALCLIERAWDEPIYKWGSGART